jgi:pentalenic acid synthase
VTEEFTFPMPRTCPFAPPPEYARMRALGPIVRATLPNGLPVWAVTRQAEARELLRDPRIVAGGRPERPRGPDDDRPDEGFFIDLDPPEHTRYRQALIPELGIRAITAFRPRIGSIVDGLLDGLLASEGSVDLVSRFARPVTVRVLCALYGVPEKDWSFFESRMRRLTVLRLDPRAPEASRELRGYLRGLAGRKDPDGLIGRLAARGDLSPDAVVNMGFLMLLAGYESPANMISLGVVTLLEHPAQLAALRTDPGLLASTVDELLRFHSVQDWVSVDRKAAADVEVAGVTVRAGDRLVVLTASANRDERAIERPDDLDVRRPPHQHLAFGHGVHQCVGHTLARAELEIAYDRLFARIPTLRLTVPLAELPFAYDAAFFGLHELPVTWDAP